MELAQQVLRDKVISKVEEMIQCASNMGRTDCFEISIKHIDGELISRMNFGEQEKVKLVKKKSG